MWIQLFWEMEPSRLVKVNSILDKVPLQPSLRSLRVNGRRTTKPAWRCILLWTDTVSPFLKEAEVTALSAATAKSTFPRGQVGTDCFKTPPWWRWHVKVAAVAPRVRSRQIKHYCWFLLSLYPLCQSNCRSDPFLAPRNPAIPWRFGSGKSRTL